MKMKLQEPGQARSPSKPETLTISYNTKRCPVTERGFVNVSEVSQWKFCDCAPEGTKCDRIVSEDES